MEHAFIFGLGVLAVIIFLYLFRLFFITKKINVEKAIHVEYRKKMMKVARPNHLSVIEEFGPEE